MKKTILIIFLFVLASCGNKEVKTEVNVDFSQFINGGFPDGAKVVLYGKSIGGKSFTRVLTDTNFSSDIPVDIWNFYIIGWSGSANNTIDPFQDGSACAVAENVDLTGAEVSLDLQMTNTDCARIDSSYDSASNVHTFAPINIKIITLMTGGACSGNTITLPGSNLDYCTAGGSAIYFIQNSNNSNPIPGVVESTCLYTGGSLNLPRGNQYAVSGFKVFSESGCVVDPNSAPKVLRRGDSNVRFVPSSISGTGDKIYLII